MPLLKIQTNVEVPRETAGKLLTQGTELLATHLKKPVDYVQVAVEPGLPIAFAGTEESTAFVEVRSLGFPEVAAVELTAALCSLLEAELGVPPGRVFLNFVDIPRPMWGWNGKTFG